MNLEKSEKRKAKRSNLRDGPTRIQPETFLHGHKIQKIYFILKKLNNEKQMCFFFIAHWIIKNR